MSTIFKLLAPLLIRFLRAVGPSIPGINHEALARNRRKLQASLVWAVVSLTAILGGVLTSVIDAAVQYEQHGEIEFNVVMMLAVGAFALGIVAAFVARANLPGFNDLMDVGRKARVNTVKPSATIAKNSSRRPEYAR